MKKRAAFLTILSMSSLAGMALQAHAATYGNMRAAHPYYSLHKSSKKALFSNIDGSGNLKISVVPIKTSTREFFSVREPAKSTSKVYAHIRNHTLYLRQSGGSQNKPAVVTIHMNNLNHLGLYGNSSLAAKNLNSDGFSLTTNTTGTIDINGMIKLNEVSVTGPSKVNLAWVKGNDIVLYSKGHSRINIAGEVGTVRAKLSGHSFLNAKYLRAQHTWIKTINFAQAEVLSSTSLQAYPDDKSNIYYYKTPKLLNPVNSQSGNTLQLGWKS
jgi:hypothetical protein